MSPKNDGHPLRLLSVGHAPDSYRLPHHVCATCGGETNDPFVKHITCRRDRWGRLFVQPPDHGEGRLACAALSEAA